jgi:hypothetical protein
MKSEELLRYQEMYREMERALKTRLLTFGFPRRAEWSREPRRREGDIGADLGARRKASSG